MVTRDEFLSALKAMHFINAADLPELTFDQWVEFRFDPADFLIRSNEQIRNAVWREVERSLVRATT